LTQSKELQLLIAETTIALVVTLAILVMVHEWGHFMAAKLVGVRVEEFAFGFGPKLIRLFKRGDTEYTIHPFPLGGFVRMAGAEPGEDEDDPQGYNAQPIWKRFVIIFAGPFMSFFLAYVIFCSLGLTMGLPEAGPPTNAVGQVRKGSPADKVGLKQGDKVIAIDGHSVNSGPGLQAIVFKSAGRELTLDIRRGGRVFTVRATPESEVVEGKKVGLLGVTLEPSGMKRLKFGVWGSVSRGTRMTVAFVKEIFDALTTKKGLKEVGGVVAITRVTAEGVKYGPDVLIFQLAALSLTLAIMNLLPWPILDGGHILLLGLELVRRRKLTITQLQVYQSFGLATLVALAIFLVYLDLTRWVPLGRPLIR
jgi:regulator of sigma E protease